MVWTNLSKLDSNSNQDPLNLTNEPSKDGDRAALRGVRGQEGEEDEDLRHVRQGGRRLGIQQGSRLVKHQLCTFHISLDIVTPFDTI